jgi:hypothetical protein
MSMSGIEQGTTAASDGRSGSAVVAVRALAPFRTTFAAAISLLAVAVLAAPSRASADQPQVFASCFGASHEAINLDGNIIPNRLETHWRFEYSTTAGGPWTAVPGGQGTITQQQAEELPPSGQVTVNATLAGIVPEKPYYVLLTATSSDGTASTEATDFRTGKPGCEAFPLYVTPRVNIRTTFENITSTSAMAVGEIRLEDNASEVHWRYELASSESGPWAPAAGAKGVFSKAEAEAALLSGIQLPAEAELTGLKPGTVYYVRLVAEDEPEYPEGSGKMVPKQAVSQPPVRIETSGPPSTQTFAVHALHGELVRILGAVTPNNQGLNEVQTVTVGGGPSGGTFTLGFSGQTTKPIPFNATNNEVRSALEALPALRGPNLIVNGPVGGPYVIEFVTERRSSAQPLLDGDASGLTPSGTVTVAETRKGFSYPTHYHFEYVNREGFERNGFVGASSTAPQSVAGTRSVIAGEDLPGLRPGDVYDYRLVADNTTPGDPVVDGPAQTFSVPTPASGGEPAVCPNEAFRTGLSGALSDCRAYEQVTPVDKEGAQEVFHYGPTMEGSGALVGEDGEHVMVGSPETNWGAGPKAGESPYFFTRSGSGWNMTAASTQPETGVNRIAKQVLFSPDLTNFGFDSYWRISPTSESSSEEFRIGPPGGPYTTVAKVPRAAAGQGWVAASEDFSHVVLQVADHKLLGSSTGTQQGEDLYEYSVGALRQVNVLSHGAPVGTCGARIAKGESEAQHPGTGGSSRHAMSTSGSRVFFEAVPGGNCAAPENLYMREAATDRTVDIGQYTFAAANAQGTMILIEKSNGGEHEFFLYDVESGVAKLAFSSPQPLRLHEVSEDFTAMYIATTAKLTSDAPATTGEYEDLYRYDIAGGTLRFLLQVDFGGRNGHDSPTPNGEDYYFSADIVSGVPAGQGSENNPQVYRYDNTTNTVVCMSCASTYDPEPKLGASFAGYGLSPGVFVNATQGVPSPSSFSADGDYAFFDTASALVPQDVDHEIAPVNAAGEGEYVDYSPSSDVYEWRKEGVNGCAHVQGCLSLISSGLGGFKVLLLGTAHDGRDVFFSDFSQLVPSDNDTAGDVYDARIGGGFPTRAPSVECEGDACSTPVTAPIDQTPSSLTFSGSGNDRLVSPAPASKTKAKFRVKRCGKRASLIKGRCIKRRRAKRSKRTVGARVAVQHIHGGHR